MEIAGQSYHSIWIDENDEINIIDQRWLPHEFRVVKLRSVADVARSIREMWVRGAPLIGVTAAFGMYLGTVEAKDETNSALFLKECSEQLLATRPTAVNLQWAIHQQLHAILQADSPQERIKIAYNTARRIRANDMDVCQKIGEHGISLIENISAAKQGATVNVLTHCNAGWLACVDWGTATSPIYQAYDKGIDLHVWVDETRPRNQGARLTAWELAQHGVPHTIITDNAGGHLMQHGMVDVCIVGTDRTTRTGDVANKIGTYLKALAAKDNNIPFYVALPSSTIDWEIADGLKEIPIEVRGDEEVLHIYGLHEGEIKQVRLAPKESKGLNYGFDVTPARLVTGLITEKGICKANECDIKNLFS
mgnify:CR=1 FL=1